MNIELVSRFRNLHFIEKNFGHIGIEMLAGMNNFFFDSQQFKLTTQCGSLNKLRTCTNYCNNFFHKVFNNFANSPVNERREKRSTDSVFTFNDPDLNRL